MAGTSVNTDQQRRSGPSFGAAFAYEAVQVLAVALQKAGGKGKA